MSCLLNMSENHEITRYTTPKCIFQVDINTELIKDCKIYFNQFGKTIFKKINEDCEINTECNTITVELTEEETGLLNSRLLLNIQLEVEFQDGDKDKSDIISIEVKDVLNEVGDVGD